MTRRAVLAGGALALLAGCGEEEEEVVATPADALARQLDAERALADATGTLPEGAPRSAAGVVRDVHARAQARAQKVAAAAPDKSGPPSDEIKPVRVDAGEAVALAQAAIVAHVAALPSLAGRDLRELGAEMVTGAAADTALLGDALGVPVDDPFPGTPR